MTHRILNNQLAYKAEKPWHGLGVQVDANATGVDMLIAAGLDWTVQRRTLAMRDGNGQGLIVDPLAGFRAIVRRDTDEVFQVATNRYHPLQNAEIVDFFKEYCEAGHATMETVGAIDGGRKIWALAKLNGGSTTKLQGVDELRGYMLLATSHDGSLRTIGKATQVRVVCWNTLSAAIGEKGNGGVGEFKMKHTRKWSTEIAKEAQKTMGMAIEQILVANHHADTLSMVEIDQKGREQFVRLLTGGMNDDDAMLKGMGIAPAGEELSRLEQSLLDAMVSSPGSDLVTAKGTMWGAVNGVTYYVDHERGRGQDSRLSQAWFGVGDRLKRDAVKVGLQMAGIGVN